ncbi:DNA helicase [Aliihoeflea aestuarii]|uniref:DNA helicase n=1 Tax=Aliihoeflea aestuarii TaxID=453840 RepID=UPI002095DA51|nr:DNA helicase [Aliihoeflea aestuarii]MCO6392724.1 DNA helicase [Aliihoeflea aestuarii]
MKLTRPVFRLKRDARIASKAHGIPLHSALDRVAADEGYKSWSLLAAAHASASPEDFLYSRLSPGSLILIGSRPGQGKTMMGMKLAARAVRSGSTSTFFTLEYSAKSAAERVRQLQMPEGCEQSFRIDCSNDICADYIAAQLQTSPNGALAVIDYLQILDQRRETPPLDDQVRSLKAFARRQGLIFAFVSQIDRSFEMAGRSCPDLRDVRLPNELDLSLFDHAVFLHDGQVRMHQPRNHQAN